MPSTSLRMAKEVASADPSLLDQFVRVRALSVHLAEPLSAEDQSAQSMPDASPTKWHLAHTTWFFETFILRQRPDYVIFDEQFSYLFNSYYEALGARQPRPQRGLLTRPSVEMVLAYRRHVDQAMVGLLSAGDLDGDLKGLIILGCAHEEQHQELLLTDILHLFGQSPLRPAYNRNLRPVTAHAAPEPVQFVAFEGGVVEIGAVADPSADGFVFDNETPRHQVLLRPFHLADRLVTNGEWRLFMTAGGYARADLWLSDGWARVQADGWKAPLYWLEDEHGDWTCLTLSGPQPIQADAPVTHVSFYEADAYARWRGLRLPTEAEWEHAAACEPVEGNFVESGALRPCPAQDSQGRLRQLYGDCWEWTASAYTPYPGFKAAEGAVGEYNGKFMINQMILRGGSCATSQSHIRSSYRNFFHPQQRWQFSGVRLASDGPAQPAKEPVQSDFLKDVLDGLSKPQKAVPSKYFYDEAGSALFEAICAVEEYYPTRVETALLEEIAPALSRVIPNGAALVEFGSGASIKTRLLLDAAPQLSSYAPIDISPDALEPAAQAIKTAYPNLNVIPVTGDFTRAMQLPTEIQALPRVGFFPGSTIGNFSRQGAQAFLSSAKTLLGADARFIVGVDLVKEESVLVAAYDDAMGVTRDFNLNLLTRINRELSGDFDLAQFSHKAVWNAEESRMEAHLISKGAQTVTVADETFAFAANETIHTENSYKYEPETFIAVAQNAGWRVESSWISPPPRFAIFMLTS